MLTKNNPLPLSANKPEHSIFSGSAKKLSEKIAREFELPVIGIDFFGEDVIEVNSGPSLFYPTGDKSSTICVEKYVEMISKMEV